mmetsp:Transcript_23850/g.29341  ORF Transcript_23850/g.29341 Transcript_23850/m.29341 type:complete len:172 (-) Transcript_23850:78-593(-)
MKVVVSFFTIFLLLGRATAFIHQLSTFQQRLSRYQEPRAITRTAIEKKTEKIVAIAAITLASFHLALAFPLSAEAQIDITRGGEIFTGNCAGCHAGGMNFVKENKNLKKEALEKFVSPGLDQPEVQSWLMKSGQHQKLVFFKAPSGNGKLTEADYADVTSYVVDQAVGDKW